MRGGDTGTIGVTVGAGPVALAAKVVPAALETKNKNIKIYTVDQHGFSLNCPIFSVLPTP